MKLRLIVAIATLAVFAGTIVAQHKTKRQSSFNAFVTRLPEIDRIEILTVTPVQTDEPDKVDCTQTDVICSPSVFPLHITEVKTLAGEEAVKLAAVWRKLKRGEYDPCFAPDRVLKFFHNDKLVLSTAVNVLGHEITIPKEGAVNVSGSMEWYYQLQAVLMPDDSFDSRFESFKGRMTPKVGEKITVIGVLGSGKLGWYLQVDEWGIYLRSHTKAGLVKTNNLNRLYCKMVQVTGPLRYFPKPPPLPPGGRVVGQAPEHFYLDVEDTQVVGVKATRSYSSRTLY